MPVSRAAERRSSSSPAIDGWSCGDVLFERYRYPPGPAGEMGKHAHAEYQWCLSIDAPGEYEYRGARHAVPAGSLSILHPGEAHSARDPDDRAAPARYLVMYVPPQLIAESAGSEPFFPTPVIEDVHLGSLFARAHLAARRPEARLEFDTLFARLVHAASAHHGERPAVALRAGREPRAVALALDYIEQHYADGVSLHQLAELGGISPAHLNRTFRRAVGVPPHRYQLALRVDRARRLLATGMTVVEAALTTGFADQSHLTRHFGRLVGLTPGRYRALSKNVQDSDRP
jgi:AraC-like DNA-binding protein